MNRLSPSLRGAGLTILLLTLGAISHSVATSGAESQKGEELTPKLQVLAKKLRSPTSADRIKAAKEISELGDESAPLIRALCEVLLDRSPKVVEAALAAIEKVRPDLHRSLDTLVTEKDPARQAEAAEELAGLGEKAVPALPVVLARLRNLPSSQQAAGVRAKLLHGCMMVVGYASSGEPAAFKHLLAYAGPASRSKDVREVALMALGRLIAGRQALRKQAIPVVEAALSNASYSLTGLEVAGQLGTDGKPLLPALKRLARSPDDLVRKAVTEATEVIEGKRDPGQATTAARARQVRIALAWLVSNQRGNGSWPTKGGNINIPLQVVTASWCGLALMEGGKQYWPQVDKAAAYVADNILQDRLPVRLPANLDQSNWKVAIGGLFLCEYYAAMKAKNPRWRSANLHKLLEQLVADASRRMEPSGGWGHTPRVKCPLGYVELVIVSNWMLPMMGAARQLGFKVPARDVKKAIQFIENCCNPDEGGVGYSPRPGQKGFGDSYRTGGAIFAFAVLGEHKHPLYDRMVKYWTEEVGSSGEGHGSVAMGYLCSAFAARQVGEAHWLDYSARFFPNILAHGRVDGSFSHLTGTTPKSIGFDHMHGDAYNTGAYALVLQLDRGKLKWIGQRVPTGKEPPPPIRGTPQNEEGPHARIIRLTNEFRKSQGLAGLSPNDKLGRTAQKHAENMASQDKYGDDNKTGHVLDGKDWNDRAKAQGYTGAVHENVGKGTGLANANQAAAKLMRGWQDSPPHRANLLHKAALEMGVGLARSKSGVWYGCQLFGMDSSKQGQIVITITNRAGHDVTLRVRGQRATAVIAAGLSGNATLKGFGGNFGIEILPEKKGGAVPSLSVRDGGKYVITSDGKGGHKLEEEKAEK